MPRVSAHLVKSAIRLERQSTTVPNTSNTNAFTAEISDMFAPCLRFVIPGWSEGPDPESRDSGFALRAPRNDDSKHLAILHETGDIGDLVVEDAAPAYLWFGSASAPGSRLPPRPVEQILDDTGELAVDVGAQQKHRLPRTVKPPPPGTPGAGGRGRVLDT